MIPIDSKKVIIQQIDDLDNQKEWVDWISKYGEDISTNYAQNAAIPKRMLPALISGLTVELANKRPKLVDINRRQELIQMYEKEWELAREEDEPRDMQMRFLLSRVVEKLEYFQNRHF